MKILFSRAVRKLAEHTARVTLSPLHDRTELTRDAQDRATLILGIKKVLPMNRRRLVTLLRRIIREAQAHEQTSLMLELAAVEDLPGLDIPRTELLRLLGENMHMAAYEFTAFKSKSSNASKSVQEVHVVGACTKAELHALALGETVANEVNACRDLANMPGGDMTPKLLASKIQGAAKGTAARVRVLTEHDMKRLKMGAVLGVARGAKELPRFIVVEYWGAAKQRKPVVLVGKGVTFDTGGLSLKPADYMLDMHLDMSGGAAVAHAVLAAARLKLKVNAVALVPAVENAVSGESYRPGDVLRSMSGKTIDILNTDAEGRVILADGLTYAKKYEPSLVVDVATLTGASLVALGTHASAVLSKDEELAQRLCGLGETSGDYCWPLPLWEEYHDMVRGRFADVANVPTENARYAGTIGGGMFLAEFVDDYPWAHIDIAPRMTSTKGDFLASGAAGAPVRLLVRLLEEYT